MNLVVFAIASSSQVPYHLPWLTGPLESHCAHLLSLRAASDPSLYIQHIPVSPTDFHILRVYSLSASLAHSVSASGTHELEDSRSLIFYSARSHLLYTRPKGTLLCLEP